MVRLLRDSDFFVRATRLFDELIELPGQARAAALTTKARGDSVLEEAVGWLLEHDAAAQDFLEAPAYSEESTDAPALTSSAEAYDPDVGRVVGSYRTIRRLGQGGMSRVYLAEQQENGAQVAVKFLQPGFANPDGLRRFDQERQILSGLDHPCIARWIDAGFAAKGAPFLVMEYVDGLPITHHCDEARLPLARRVRLFLSACGAVAHAHRGLVAHRDLKPGNILVGGDGRPKLLDFGLAKMLGPSEGTDSTRSQARVLTPNYASPEQLAGARLTVGTDIYSLGIILYELLAGRRPDDRSDRWPNEIIESLSKRPLPAPSTVFRPATGSQASEVALIAATRGGSPAAVRRQLEGDLDAIVLKALRYEPELRYGSVAELADDLRAHLEQRPVSARPAGVGVPPGLLPTV